MVNSFEKTRTGRLGMFLGTVARERKRQVSFARDVERPIGGRKRTGRRRGRPRGTVKYTDPRTGQPIGVYEYRKILSAQLRAQRIKQLKEAALSPEQKEALRRIDERRRMQQMSVESRTIPDTYGQVKTKSIHDEIDDAANIVS